MKKILTILLLFISLLSFSQEKEVIKSGYITFNSGSILEFKNLTIEGQKISYFNEVSKTQMDFALQSVNSIVDGSGKTVYKAGKTMAGKLGETTKVEMDADVAVEKKEKLVYKSVSRIYQEGKKLTSDDLEQLMKSNSNVYNRYKKGKDAAILGDVLMGGGLGLFVGGGLSNLSRANSGKGGGSPAILVVGLVTGIIGIPVKIGGVKNVKKAVEGYNALYAKRTAYFEKPEVRILAGTNGVGFSVQF